MLNHLTVKQKQLLVLAVLIFIGVSYRVVRHNRQAAATRTAISAESDATRQAKAMKAYQDYQYVKYRGPISGPMYRSTKW